MQEAIGELPKTLPPSERTEKNADAVKRGRKGAKKGGAARIAKLKPEQREGLAQLAAEARWKKSRP